MGESFGGILGLNFAHKHPQPVRALVLCNTPADCRAGSGPAWEGTRTTP